ncbi:hypothetical protein HPB50_005526 [Hyalomma asiaticum]|uniref:Uncharacterized protein n=1 Tax=Hyalomma asiaticum TaxID=266040 RepID=A0ACB7TJ17_HYAAI|nr:hypothetical protein HPB50_005526 [Hyalomma asiaticum]
MPTVEKLRNDVISDTDMDMPTISTRTMQRMLTTWGSSSEREKGIPYCSNETTSLLGVESTSVQSEKCGGSSESATPPLREPVTSSTPAVRGDLRLRDDREKMPPSALHGIISPAAEAVFHVREVTA